MLGDGAVAVHPSDERYKKLVGKMVRLPIAERLIPIIADEYPDPEFGTGAVKITGAHDENDFHVAKRNNIPLIVLMDKRARMISTPENNVPAHYDGLDRYKARELVLKEIEELGFYRGKEDKIIAQPHGDRSGVVIEPMLTEQWYVNAAELAKPAIAAVESGDTKFVPGNWDKTYFEWMRNIQPWCISRQLWWGHQIPAWYGPDGAFFVAETEQGARAQATAHYGKSVEITRDEDVLDTWFSSALWPFSTLGWPDETPELKRHYKTDVLVTGFDIIFFWVARMMMMGTHFMHEVPFHTVYIHALVRDEKGQKMSKSKGNVMDPLEIVDEFGADALRFTLAAMAAQGRDIKLSKTRVEGYRNFATKLWNATRFAEMNGVARDENYDPLAARVQVNRWITGETARARNAVTKAIEEYKFNEAASTLYQFAWGVFCDWYVELVKPILTGDDETAKAETRATAAWVLDQIFTLLHPFMPFITEELWQKTAVREVMLIDGTWPEYKGLGDAAADAEMNWVIRLITEVRSVRAEMNVNAGAKIPCMIVGASQETRRRANAWEAEIMRLARLSSLTFEDEVPKSSAQIALDEATVALPLEGMIDFAAEKARLNKELEKIAKDMGGIDGRLNNPAFVAKAPQEVLDESRELKVELEARKAKVGEALKRLG
jgi:valyl-tRNA synthetase